MEHVDGGEQRLKGQKTAAECEGRVSSHGSRNRTPERTLVARSNTCLTCLFLLGVGPGPRKPFEPCQGVVTGRWVSRLAAIMCGAQWTEPQPTAGRAAVEMQGLQLVPQ
jgi:hypothetical protein